MKLPIIKKTPELTAGGAIYRYSEALTKRFTMIDRFDKEMRAFRVILAENDRRTHIEVPRGCAIGLGEDLRVVGDRYEFESRFTARNQEQERITCEGRRLLSQLHSFIIQAPTGIGKTAMMLDLIAYAKVWTIVIVTKEDLLEQWRAECKKFLGLEDNDIGVIQGDKVVIRPITIAMVHSVSKAGRYPDDTFSKFGLCVIDEVHRMGAETFHHAMFNIPARQRVGLSATPYRKDGRECLFTSHIGPVMVQSELLTLTPKITVYRNPQRIYAFHDFGRTMKADRVLSENRDRNAVICEYTRIAYERGRTVIVFSSLRDHLAKLRTQLTFYGVPLDDSALYVGGMTEKQRDEAKIKRVILATYAFTAEATDLPWLDTAVLATPRSDVKQVIGRILREYPDKKEPAILDIVDKSHILDAYASKRRRLYEQMRAPIKEWQPRI